MKKWLWSLYLFCLVLIIVSGYENVTLIQYSLGAYYSEDEEVPDNNADATNWFRRTTNRVQEKVQDGKEQLDERVQQTKEQAKEKIEALLPNIENPPPSPSDRYFRWLCLYAWYGFCSPYTFFLYAALIALTFVRQYNAERKFSGSIFYIILLCLFVLVSLYVTSNAWKQGDFWELIWKDDVFVLLFPNSIMLLICYICVSRVLIERYEKKRDEFFEQFKEEMEANRHSETDGTTGEIDGTAGDVGGATGGIDVGIHGSHDNFWFLWLIFFLILAILFAPALICFKFVVNYIIARPVVLAE